jgi:Protein of unknown function (DUF3617)
MKINVSLGFALLFCGAALAADSVQPLDVKLGLWESTTTMEHSGAPPIPDEVLAKLTPEQRAKIEERAKASAQQGPKTTTRKSCIKKEDLDKAMAFGNNDKNCHRTILTSSSSKLEFRIECGAGTMKSNGDVHIEAISSEHVKGSVQMTIGDGTRSMKLNSTFESKWLGPVCEASK